MELQRKCNIKFTYGQYSMLCMYSTRCGSRPAAKYDESTQGLFDNKFVIDLNCLLILRYPRQGSWR